MLRNQSGTDRQRGIALLFTLMTLLVLSVLAAALLSRFRQVPGHLPATRGCCSPDMPQKRVRRTR